MTGSNTVSLASGFGLQAAGFGLQASGYGLQALAETLPSGDVLGIARRFRLLANYGGSTVASAKADCLLSPDSSRL